MALYDKKVENPAALAELYLKFTKLINKEELESQFDIKNLSP
jgi:hypothetical protein